MHMFGYGYPVNWSWGWGIGMFLMMALWVTLIVGVIYLIARSIRTDKYSNSRNVMEILDIKLAQGEISEEEYIKKKNVLKQK